MSEADRAIWEEIRQRFKRIFDEHHAMVARCLGPSERLLSLTLGDPRAAAKVISFLGCSVPVGPQSMPHVTGANAAAVFRMQRDDQARL